jgi:DNA-directed RNA polymerase subunit RPC12/RpoP
VYEVLYHYNCGECSNWWSYATTPKQKYDNLEWGVIGKYVYCPHCGTEAQVKVKEDFSL